MCQSRYMKPKPLQNRSTLCRICTMQPQISVVKTHLSPVAENLSNRIRRHNRGGRHSRADQPSVKIVGIHRRMSADLIPHRQIPLIKKANLNHHTILKAYYSATCSVSAASDDFTALFTVAAEPIAIISSLV